MTRKLLLIIISLAIFSDCVKLNGQIISTIAGNGIGSSTGDGGLATGASVAYPAFGMFDGKGNYYFEDGHASTGTKIRMINAAGIISTVVGNGTSGYGGDGGLAIDAQINSGRLFVDSFEYIYIADYENYRVRKVNIATGIINTISGNGTNSSTGNGGPATSATLVPIDVCADRYGNVFISDQYANSIRKIDVLTGIITQIAPTSAQGMCFDGVGNIYLGGGSRIFKLNISSGVIDTIAGTGNAFYNGDNIPATSANITVFDLAIDKYGNLFIADHGNERVRMINRAGIINTIAGTGLAGYNGDGIIATTAMIYNPEGIAVDSCGNLVIAVSGNNRIRKVTFPKCGYLSVNESVSENKTAKLNLYPNPANNELTITATEKIKSVSICNAVGQSFGVAHENRSFGKLTMTINIAHLPVGVYFVRVNDIYVQRFIKE